MLSFSATKEKCQDNVITALRLVGRENKCRQLNLIQDYSYNVVSDWNRLLDLLFIDGDHRYEAVKKDFEDWYPHIKKGGFVLFHDSQKLAGTPPETFDLGWLGPTQLANELATDTRLTLVESACSISVFQKL